MRLPPQAQPHLSRLEQHLAGFRDDLEGKSLLALASDLRGAADAALAAAAELVLADEQARQLARGEAVCDPAAGQPRHSLCRGRSACVMPRGVPAELLATVTQEP